MTPGEIAGLIAAVAACVFVALAAVPLIKLGRVLDEAQVVVRDLGKNTVPVLQDLKTTVSVTNEELAKLSLVTDDVSRVSGHATVVSENAAQVSTLLTAAVGKPLIKTAAFSHGVRAAIAGRKK